MKYHNISSWEKTFKTSCYSNIDRMIKEAGESLEFYKKSKGITPDAEEKRLERIDLLEQLKLKFIQEKDNTC